MDVTISERIESLDKLRTKRCMRGRTGEIATTIPCERGDEIGYKRREKREDTRVVVLLECNAGHKTCKKKSNLPEEFVDCPFFATPHTVTGDYMPLRTHALEHHICPLLKTGRLFNQETTVAFTSLVYFLKLLKASLVNNLLHIFRAATSAQISGHSLLV